MAAYFGLSQRNGISVSKWEHARARVPNKYIYKLERLIAYADMLQEERERFHQIRLREAGLTV